jgi:hypothetical protein
MNKGLFALLTLKIAQFSEDFQATIFCKLFNTSIACSKQSSDDSAAFDSELIAMSAGSS